MADLENLHVSFQSLQQAEMEAKKLYGPQADISKRIVPYLKDGILHFEARQKGFLLGMKSLSRQFAGREGIQTGRADILGALGQLTTAQKPQTNPKLQGLISRTALAAEHIFGKKVLSYPERLYRKTDEQDPALDRFRKSQKALYGEIDALYSQLLPHHANTLMGRTPSLTQYRAQVLKEVEKIFASETDSIGVHTIIDTLWSLSNQGNSLAKDLLEMLMTRPSYQQSESNRKTKVMEALQSLQANNSSLWSRVSKPLQKAVNQARTYIEFEDAFQKTFPLNGCSDEELQQIKKALSEAAPDSPLLLDMVKTIQKEKIPENIQEKFLQHFKSTPPR